MPIPLGVYWHKVKAYNVRILYVSIMQKRGIMQIE